MWRTRVICFKENHILGQNVCPYLHVHHEQIISLSFHEDRHIVLVGLLLLMTLLHILTQPCSGCYLFIFWHRLIISAMKACYYQTVGEVTSQLSYDLWSQGQIDFGGIFVSGIQHFYILTLTYDLWYECGLLSGSVNHIFMSLMGHWHMTSTSNNGYKFRSQLPHLTRFNI